MEQSDHNLPSLCDLPVKVSDDSGREEKKEWQGFSGGAVVGSLPADAGDTGSCPGPGGSRVPRSVWAREPWPLGLRVRSLQWERPQQ